MAKGTFSKAARLLVIGLAVVHALIVTAQNFDFVPLWASEISRFIPFYWLGIPLLFAVAVSCFAGRAFIALALANILLFSWLTMDFHWATPTDDSNGVRLRVLSYNIKALHAERVAGGLSQIQDEVVSYAPDIVALQDAQKWLVTDAGSQVVPVRPVFGLPYVMAVDQFVLASRYPLSDCHAAPLDSSVDLVQYLNCTADVAGIRIQLVTTHFVSPRSSLIATKNDFSDGVQVWRRNLDKRLVQSRALLAVISMLPRPVIVMGDLNAPEASPVVQTIKYAGLSDAFAAAGRGWGFTHGHALSRKMDLFRIDHILASPGLRFLRAEVGRGDASEHNPVYADMRISENNASNNLGLYR